MELKAKELYRCPEFELYEGDTTVGLEISDEKKAQMLFDFPDSFEEIGVEPQKTKVVEDIQTPEDGLVIETPEAKEPKTRKK